VIIEKITTQLVLLQKDSSSCKAFWILAAGQKACIKVKESLPGGFQCQFLSGRHIMCLFY